MKYYIQRGLNEYGPYTLADLQRYIVSGNIQLTDLTRSEGMTDWVPVSQVIGNIPLPGPATPPGMPAGAQPSYGQPGYGQPAHQQPAYGQPASAQPNTAQPGSAQPGAVQPGAVQPGAAQPGAQPSYTPTPAAPEGTVYGGPAASPGRTAYSAPEAAPGSTVYGTPGSPGGPGYAGTPAYGSGAVPMQTSGPIPPDLHWALVLLITFFCSIFGIVWKFIQASYVKKLVPGDSAIMFYAFAVGSYVLGFILYFGGIFSAVSSARGREPDVPFGLIGLFVLFMLGALVLRIVGNFKMRESLLQHYNSAERINLRLSPVMTFFFGTYYFQYHFGRISAWKKTGYLAPQQLT